MSNLPSVTTGTITIQQNTRILTGTGTVWRSANTLENLVTQGDIAVSGIVTIGIVDTVDSANQITLLSNYTGTTLTNATYRIIRKTATMDAAVIGQLQRAFQIGTFLVPLAGLVTDVGNSRLQARAGGTNEIAFAVGAQGADESALAIAFIINSVTRALGARGPFGLHSLTTTQRDALGTVPNGTLIYNSTTLRVEIFEDGAWRQCARRTGDAFTGDVTIGQNTTGWRSLNIAAAAANRRRVLFSTGPTLRWALDASDAPESGANAGSNFEIIGYDDSGTFLGTALLISRANFSVTAGADNTRNLGSGSLRWATIFAGTGTINTSDAREKDNIAPITDELLDKWAGVEAISFKFKNRNRTHFGYTAQQVLECMGEDAWTYALLCRDQITKPIKRTVTKLVQKTEPKTVSEETVEIKDGVPTVVVKTRETQEPVVEMVQVIGADGKPVMDADGKPRLHPVPVMIESEVEETVDEPAGDRLGLRYDQCAVIEAAWARRELSRALSRIAALEAA